jgi:hypothetical protein
MPKQNFFFLLVIPNGKWGKIVMVYFYGELDKRPNIAVLHIKSGINWVGKTFWWHTTLDQKVLCH